MNSNAQTSGAPASRRGPLAFLLAIYAGHALLLAAYGHLRPERLNIRGIDPVAYYSFFHSLYFDHALSIRPGNPHGLEWRAEAEAALANQLGLPRSQRNGE